MGKATLWDIAAEMQALDDLLFENGGDVSDPNVATIIDAWLAETGSAFAGKVDGYVALITTLEARATARLAEVDRLKKRIQVDANAADRLKARLKMVFDSRQLKKLETGRYVVSVAMNGGKLPLIVEPTAKIPEDCTKTIPAEVVPDNDAIRAALEAGREIPGARLGERGSSLRIR